VDVLVSEWIADRVVFLVESPHVAANALLPLRGAVIDGEREVHVTEDGVAWPHHHERDARLRHDSLQLEQGLGDLGLILGHQAFLYFRVDPREEYGILLDTSEDLLGVQ
jgi:hypothetical protein